MHLQNKNDIIILISLLYLCVLCGKILDYEVYKVEIKF